MDYKKPLKNPEKYLCEACAFKTQHKRDYDKHLLTAKHQRVTNGNIKTLKNPKSLVCVCGKEYKNRHTLSRHRKICDYKEDAVDVVEPPNILNPAMVLDIIKENQEFKKLILDLHMENKELINKMTATPQTIINNINNNVSSVDNSTVNNNQKFNLNFFLNETCKDAMNIQDFMENLCITFQDLLNIGNDGFVAGVSDIFIKQLRGLDVTKRPIHCTDSKRDTIYLKENGEWSKDTNEKTRLKNIIEKVEYKNVAALREWCNENPDTKINNTDNNLLRDKIYLQTLQGDDRTREKIIKNISREVVVEKDT
jgi:hypothetical protein